MILHVLFSSERIEDFKRFYSDMATVVEYLSL